jgi:predicted dehydrogenase
VGFIGFGDRGTELFHLLRSCPNTVAVAFADAYTKQLDRAKSLAPEAAIYQDYRRLLEDPSVDAVIVATPQHLHAAQFCDALAAGKHVYQERTMALTVDHAKRMRASYQNDGGRHVVQIGHQACSFGQMSDVRTFLREAERMGRITAINMRMYRNTPLSKPQWSRKAQLTPDLNPRNVDWNAFLGDTPAREFDPHRFIHWRYFGDYSGGGVHENMSQQLAFWYKALDLGIPGAVTMTGGIYLWKDGREVPDTMSVSLEQPEGMLINWTSGFGNNHPGVSEEVLGTHGTITRDQQVRYLPQKVNRPAGNEMAGRAGHAPQVHLQNFIDAIRGNAAASCPFELGYRVSIASHMAVESFRLGRTVRWDAQEEEIV